MVWKWNCFYFIFYPPSCHRMRLYIARICLCGSPTIFSASSDSSEMLPHDLSGHENFAIFDCWSQCGVFSFSSVWTSSWRFPGAISSFALLLEGTLYSRHLRLLALPVELAQQLPPCASLFPLNPTLWIALALEYPPKLLDSGGFSSCTPRG